MANMFTSYETETKNIPCPPYYVSEPPKGTKMLTNIKGEVLGVQVDYASPLHLYFHLENICEVDFNELLLGSVKFEILTTTHKILISRDYQISEILDQGSNDLYIFIEQEEMKTLKKEMYTMRVTLNVAGIELHVFAEKDGYLVIR
jgi:hypothetical protein